MADIDWELYSWVMRGNQRRKIMKSMNKPKLPTELKGEAGMSLTNVSKILKSFERKGLVKCFTPHLKTGKIYSLTAKGRTIRKEMFREK
jgi:DNA-binding MarR family transcriptional regulator